jgi:NADPH-dependent 2,4-dienoyl-CoA reductase/sulfur reductase-like enzyme
MSLRLDTRISRIEPDEHRVVCESGEAIPYDALIVGTGAVPVEPPIEGLQRLGPEDGAHLLHSMGDTFALMQTLDRQPMRKALIVGAGYIGLEMAEGLTARGLEVVQVEQLPEVLPTVDAELGALVRAELEHQGVQVHCSTRVEAVAPGVPTLIAGSPSRPADPMGPAARIRPHLPGDRRLAPHQGQFGQDRPRRSWCGRAGTPKAVARQGATRGSPEPINVLPIR